MTPDDRFRSRRDETISALTNWCRSITDIADCLVERPAGFDRVRARPFTPGACPIEIILHDDQTVDLAIGPEVYEGEPGGDPGWLVAIAEAVSAGRVITIERHSAATGRLVEIETVVDTPEGPWRRSRQIAPIAAGVEITEHARHYLPYRLTRARSA